jgi:DNA-directed RNA polymerase specialized sigma24 family protein
MNPASDACYDRLREIGVSVETADALAPILAELPPRKREAFYLWASGMNNCQVAKEVGCNEITIRRLIANVEKACKPYLVR